MQKYGETHDSLLPERQLSFTECRTQMSPDFESHRSHSAYGNTASGARYFTRRVSVSRFRLAAARSITRREKWLLERSETTL